MAEQARDAGLRVKRLEDLRTKWRDRLTQARASALPLQLADALFASPILTISQAERILGVTYRSARLNLEKLVETGVLRQIGESSYGRTYVAEDIVRIISEPQAWGA